MRLWITNMCNCSTCLKIKSQSWKPQLSQVYSEECWLCAVHLVSLWPGCSTSQQYWLIHLYPYSSPSCLLPIHTSPFHTVLYCLTTSLLPPQVGHKTKHLHLTTATTPPRAFKVFSGGRQKLCFQNVALWLYEILIPSRNMDISCKNLHIHHLGCN